LSSAADIRIEGLGAMSESEALDLLGDRLELIKAKPPSTARASDAAFLLENLMKRQGFQSPDVKPVISGNAIRLVVNEGPRIKIGCRSCSSCPARNASCAPARTRPSGRPTSRKACLC
jgi:hypothetical protein